MMVVVVDVACDAQAGNITVCLCASFTCEFINTQSVGYLAISSVQVPMFTSYFWLIISVSFSRHLFEADVFPHS